MVGSIVFDSGAFSLYKKFVYKKSLFGFAKNDFSFYESDVFWQYVDRYCDFIHENKDMLDWYAVVDVIFNPDLTWKVQRYMEDVRGLSPVPVIHFGQDLSLLKKYLKYGYDFIGLGGAGVGVKPEKYFLWADKVFDYICSRPSRLPCVRVHGFAVTSIKTMWRYPWWSVDSTRWAKASAFGSVLFPRRVKGRWDFQHSYEISFANNIEKNKRYFSGLTPIVRRRVFEWLEEIDVPLGSSNELGVSNSTNYRFIANIKFFMSVEKVIPEWPWPFRLSIESRGLF